MNLIERSFKYCEDIARSHYENFPVASKLIPADKRKYIFAVYAFARQADDYADEDGFGTKEERLRLIDEWESFIYSSDDSKSSDEFSSRQLIFVALRETISQCVLPVELLRNLLKAFRQDVVKNRYESFDEVLSYCGNSANPVGRLVLRILYSSDDLQSSDELFGYSDNICTALQLTNFWQDISIDLKKDRIYLPQEDMNRYNYSTGDLAEHKYDQRFVDLMKFEVDRTEELFNKGKRLVELVDTDKELNHFRKELKLIWFGGVEILNKIRKMNYNVFENRPVITELDKIKLLAKAALT